MIFLVFWILFLLDLYYFVIILYLNDSTLLRNMVRKRASKTGLDPDLKKQKKQSSLKKQNTVGLQSAGGGRMLDAGFWQSQDAYPKVVER